MRKLYILLAVAVMLFSCVDNGITDVDYGYIQFGMPDVSVQTRGEVSEATISSMPIYINAMRDAAVLYNNGKLVADPGGQSLWKVDNSTWKAGSRYSFYGYTASTTYSGGEFKGMTGVSSSKGKSFTVTQPNTYPSEDMVDYLLSYNYQVTDGKLRPVVRLDFEHVLPRVEIAVVKHESIKEAKVTSLKLNGVFHISTMKCTGQANYGSQTVNEWESVPNGTRINYTYASEDGFNVENDIESTSAKMAIMSVPQQLVDVAQIVVDYTVNEKSNDSDPDNWIDHTSTFTLYNYSPYVWTAGHRIRYTITIDTGIGLTGTIVDWKDVDFIEGVVLPEIR